MMRMQHIKHFFILAVATLLFACSSSGPEKVAEKYANAILTADIETFMAVLNVPENPQVPVDMMKGKMTQMLQVTAAEAKAQGGVKSIKAVSTTYGADKETAVVEVKMEFKNGTSKTETVELLNTSKGWKVDI